MLCIGSLCACPLPDIDTEVITEELNNSPVRLIEPVGLSKAARCECEPTAECDEPGAPAPSECPLPDVIGLPHFLDPHDPTYQFCACPQGSVDSGALAPIEFFAEDQDVEPDSNDPEDDLYAAILLNADPDTNPSDHVAYAARYRSPTDKLPELAGGGYQPPGRPKPYVRRIFVGDPERYVWDLCGDPLIKPGFNTFTVLVTDRDWNVVTAPADPETDTPGPPVTQTGVVDIAAGATFDQQSYTFYCSSTNDPTNPVMPGGDGNDPFKCADRCMQEGG